MGQAYEANDPMVETVPAKIPATHTIVSETPVRVAPIVHTAPVVQHVPEVAEISNTVVRSVASVPIKKKRVKKLDTLDGSYWTATPTKRRRTRQTMKKSPTPRPTTVRRSVRIAARNAVV